MESDVAGLQAKSAASSSAFVIERFRSVLNRKDGYADPLRGQKESEPERPPYQEVGNGAARNVLFCDRK